MKKSEVNIDALNDLLTRNYDAVKGYREAAKAVDHVELKNWMLIKSDQREKFIADLSNGIKILGGEPAEGTSLLGDLHRIYIDWSSDIISRPSEHLIEECIRGEEKAKDDFENVLKNEKLPISLNAILNRELREIKDSIIRLHNLENAYEKIDA